MSQPLGNILEAALAGSIQGTRLTAYKGRVYSAAFRCCITGTSVGVGKQPVPNAAISPMRVCIGEDVTVVVANWYSPTGQGLHGFYIDWGDGTHTAGGFLGVGPFSHNWAATGIKHCWVQVSDDDIPARVGREYFDIEVVDCSDEPSDTLYAACTGGVYKSVDGGVAWTQSLAVTVALALKASPFCHNRSNKELVVACWNDGLYKTDNGGDTWYELTYPYTPYAVAYSKVVEDVFFVLGEDGSNDVVVSRTDDGGLTWDHFITGFGTWKTTSHAAIETSFSGEYVFYVCDDGGTQRTYQLDEDLTNQDLLVSWAGGTHMVLAVGQDDWLYVAPVYDGAYHGLMGSDDYGDTWQDLGTDDWVGSTQTQDVVVDRFNPLHLVAVILTAPNVYDMYMSDDRGGSWREIESAMDRVFMMEKPYNDPETLYMGGWVLSADTMTASVWNGNGAFARDIGLPNSKLYDIAVLE